MSKLKIRVIEDDKPVTMTVKLSGAVHRDLVAYAAVLKQDSGHAVDPNALVAPMLARFMATDRAFAKAKRKTQIGGEG